MAQCLLPLAPDGTPGPPTAIRKEVGLAAPTHVLFHPDGVTALTSNSGQRALGLFSVHRDALSLRHRSPAAPDAPPTTILLSPDGKRLYVQHPGSTIAVHPVEATRLAPPTQLYPAGSAVMAMHPEGQILATAGTHSLTLLRLARDTGHLSPAARVMLDEPLRTLVFTPAGTTLLGIQARSGRIIQIPVHPTAATLGTPQVVAQKDGAASLLFRPA